MEVQRCPFLQKCKFSPQTDVGHSINGNDVVTIGLIELPFNISGQHFVVNCRIMRGLVRPIVIGWDFLCNRKAIINLESNNLTIKGVSTPFLLREKPPHPPHLSAFEPVVIPPFSRMPIKAYIHADLAYLQRSGSSTILSQPFIDYCPAEGVLVGSSLSSMDQGTTYCEVFNTLPTPAVIPAETLLATFEFCGSQLEEPFCVFEAIDKIEIENVCA